jgi:hypothetical protein
MIAPNKEQLLAAIRKAAAATEKEYLSIREFEERTGYEFRHVLRYYISWTEALLAAKVELEPYNRHVESVDLLIDWAEVARKNKKLPTRTIYKRDGKYGMSIFRKRFGKWSAIPARFREFAKGNRKWNDVLKLFPEVTGIPIRRRRQSKEEKPSKPIRKEYAKLPDRPLYGDPIEFRGLRHSPVNEQGVVMLFGMLAAELGYIVDCVQTGFPDCEAKRQVAPGKWQQLRIEFEFESKNFLQHGHPVEGCDLIVCWIHNWEKCPLEVVELKTEVRPESIRDHEKT